MGAYTYQKRTDAGPEHIRVMVYMLEVEKERGDWPEKSERRREWCSTSEAAQRVEESGLTNIIRQLAWGH